MPSPVRHRLPTWPVWMAIALAALVLVRWNLGRTGVVTELPPADVPVAVVRAIDGDTLLLASGHRVRLIGVDTPETKHPDQPAEPWGSEAAAFTHERVAGRDVVLDYDRERLDVYRRVLAYVYVDGNLLNESLILAGYTRAITSFPYRSDLQRRFRKAEEEARVARRGMWSTIDPDHLQAIRN